MKQAAGICVTVGNEILLLKRAPHKKHRPNTWNFPAGGMESGEDHKQTAMRELLEESGIELPNEIVNHHKTFMVEEGKEICEFHVFHAILEEKPDVLINKENTEFIWAHPEKALSLDLIDEAEEICIKDLFNL